MIITSPKALRFIIQALELLEAELVRQNAAATNEDEQADTANDAGVVAAMLRGLRQDISAGQQPHA